MSSPDIFISYNREDAAVAQLYADALTGAGLKVWWDASLRSGEDYDAVTENSLRTAKAVVVLWSPRSVGSRWVRAEATIADRGHTMVPVMIEPCDRPVMFELKQTVEMSHWRGDVYAKDWLAFVADLRAKVGHAQPAPDAPADPAAAPVPPQTGSVSAGRSTVAVLPVACRSGDGELEVLAEDLTEDVTRELAHNGHFRVIAAGSMAAWRGKPIDHKDLGRQLEARYLVEGKVQRSGKDTRLTMQLIDGNSGNLLWSTRLASDIGSAEFSADTLPVAAAAQFAEQIVQREQTRAMAKRAPFSAWDHILRSAANSLRADQASVGQAAEEARLAVEAAPDIGLAHALLASALAASLESEGLKPDAEQIREIQVQTRQAMRLDGNNPSVLMALAGAYKGLGEYEICLRLARRTVELWPSSPQSYLILGNSYRLLGRTAEAVTAYRKQDQLSPFDSSRNVALTCLGECLLAEDQPEAAEAAVDRALMLDPEYPAALEWKAIIADQLGKEATALNVMRQIHSAEAAMQLDQHVWQIERDEHLHDRLTPHVATLRRLWLAVDGPAVVPAAPRQLAEAASASRETATGSIALIAQLPAAIDAGTAPDPSGGPSTKLSAVPLRDDAPPAAARARSKPPAAQPGPVQNCDYLISPAAPVAQPAAPSGPAVPGAAGSAAAGRRFALPRVAALVGAIALAGSATAVWFTGVTPGKADLAAPVAVLADLGLAPLTGTLAAAPLSDASGALSEAASASLAGAVPAPLAGAMAALIKASRNAGRPQNELAALGAGQQSLAALLAQSAAEPANTALAEQANRIAAGLARQQGAALSADADRWLRNQAQTAAAAKRQLTPDGSALVDRALNKLRGARADFAATVSVSGRPTGALKSLGAARVAVIAYSRLVASSVVPAIASARAAAADTDQLNKGLARSRAEIGTAQADVSRLAGQVAGLAALEKPGLFASATKRQSYKLRKDNAERARALAADADRIAATSSSISGSGELGASLSRLQSLKSEAAILLASSNAALKSGAKPDDPAKAPEKK